MDMWKVAGSKQCPVERSNGSGTNFNCCNVCDHNLTPTCFYSNQNQCHSERQLYQQPQISGEIPVRVRPLPRSTTAAYAAVTSWSWEPQVYEQLTTVFFKRLKLGEKWRPRTCSSSQVTWVVTQSAAKSVAFIFHIYLTLKLIRSLQNEPLFNRAETRSCEKKVFPGVILCQTTEQCFLMDTDWSVKLTAS